MSEHAKPRLLPLDSRLERAAQLVVRARIFYELWFYFEEAKSRPPTLDVTERFGEFFRFEPHAHFVAFVVHIAGVFERRHRSINLQGLVQELKAAELIPAQTVTEVDALLDYMPRQEAEAILEVLKCPR